MGIFNLIPQDLDFWNHVLWVFPPAFVRRFCPQWVEIGRVKPDGFSAYEKIPF